MKVVIVSGTSDDVRSVEYFVFKNKRKNVCVRIQKDVNMNKLVSVLSLFLLLFSCTPKSVLSDFPEQYRPEVVGDRVVERFIKLNRHELYRGKYINYQEVCAWTGALRYARLTRNNTFLEKLTTRFNPFFSFEAHLIPPPFHVDLTVFGAIPLDLYTLTGEPHFYELGMKYADAQWSVPDTANVEEKAWANKGFSWQTRLWIDDMYMISLLQSKAYEATGDTSYICRAAREMVLYLNELQRENGLFYHAPDVPFFWGRGNGWMAVGMTELLKALPQENQNRKLILKRYRKMMRSLKEYQQPSGLWNQLIDDPECWAESSCSGMFTYALVSGVKSGWIEEHEYGEISRKAWFALVDLLNDDSEIIDVCVGTNKQDSREYYLNRKRRTGDYHGQAPIMWCAAALLENEVR